MHAARTKYGTDRTTIIIILLLHLLTCTNALSKYDTQGMCNSHLPIPKYAANIAALFFTTPGTLIEIPPD